MSSPASFISIAAKTASLIPLRASFSFSVACSSLFKTAPFLFSIRQAFAKSSGEEKAKGQCEFVRVASGVLIKQVLLSTLLARALPASFKLFYNSQLMLRRNGETFNSNYSEKFSHSFPCVLPSCVSRSNQQSRTYFFLASQYSFACLASPILALHS